MDGPVEDPFLLLSPELVQEVLLRLPPEEPAWLVRASAVRKPWRRILANDGFRGRYREFHGAPPVLGIVQEDASFLPISALPAHPVRPRWAKVKALDCRHGRYLFESYSRYFGEGEPVYITIADPLTGHELRLRTPVDDGVLWFSAAVLCAAQGCDHHGCQGGHFRVVILTTNHQKKVTSGWMYSSETRVWSDLTSAHHPNITKYTFNRGSPSVLVGDALYFDLDGIIECQLGTLNLSMFERPTDAKGRLMTVEDGGLGFAAVVDVTNLAIWSMQTGPEGAMGWGKLRVIDLTTLLPDTALCIPAPEDGISGIAEGTQIIFVSMCDRNGTYMVDLKSRRVRKVSDPGRKVFPYMRFYIPAMEAASMGQGQ
ncbi:uncharacterized protein LOC119310380 [Triticum dicoccoides]|uniref:uncharacterized protein LOC119310380 n=1 Tax=Triticum dicoccoides TaxID=85692 RepID=UPI001890EA9E|nr:uncharacterized protein LOC119310380 [Triticum dicoccoides]